MWCGKRLSLETLSILIYANGLKNTNSMLLLFNPIAFLVYINLFLSQGDINNLFSTANEDGENFNKCFNSNKFPLNAQNPFPLFSSFILTNLKQESRFQKVGGLVTRNVSVFCLQQVTLYFKAMPNSIDFYKAIFLHVFPVRIIVPCSQQLVFRLAFYKTNIFP